MSLEGNHLKSVTYENPGQGSRCELRPHLGHPLTEWPWARHLPVRASLFPFTNGQMGAGLATHPSSLQE